MLGVINLDPNLSIGGYIVETHVAKNWSLELEFVNVQGTQESIPPAYVAWRVGTSNRVVVLGRQAGNRFLGSLKGLQIRALICGIPFPPSHNVQYV